MEELARDGLVEDDDYEASIERNEQWNLISYHGLLRASNPLLSDESDDSSISLVQIYDSLVKQWITTLAADVPGRVRVAMEKRLRRIATEIYLSSYGIKGSQPGTLAAESGELGSDEDNQLVLPVRDKTLRSNLITEGKEKNRSQPRPRHRTITLSPYPDLPRISLPTPAPTPSLHSQASFSSNTPSEDPACARLQALAHLAPQPPLPDSSTRILAHWSLGTDPALYDWETTKRRLQPRTASEAREDERIAEQRRRYEKSLKRQQLREAGMGSSSQMVAPPVVSASQPDPTTVTQGSSQAQGFSSQVAEGRGTASSQRVPGVFANRGLAVRGKVGKGGKVRRRGF